ncbi:MAG: hypothetical protein MI750_16580 [Xanthomonadales bacterium]|nr:hypothetical protein [Xanthomonadales bacterium]
MLTVVDTQGFTANQAFNLQMAKVLQAMVRLEQRLGTSILHRVERRLSL